MQLSVEYSTKLHSIPYSTPPIPFLTIVNTRIVSLSKEISLIMHNLELKRLEKKKLSLASLRIQKMNFESKVKKIPMGVSSKSKRTFNNTPKTKVISPEDMIAAMTPADRLEMVRLLKYQQANFTL